VLPPASCPEIFPLSDPTAKRHATNLVPVKIRKDPERAKALKRDEFFTG
jgi:hypothetical protein